MVGLWLLEEGSVLNSPEVCLMVRRCFKANVASSSLVSVSSPSSGIEEAISVTAALSLAKFRWRLWVQPRQKAKTICKD